MACTYLELTISSIDIAAATSNSNVYPFLDNTVFVDYYDCYGNVVTEPFTVAGPYTASACTDYFIYGYPYLYYYNSDIVVSAINSTEAPGVPCIPPTPSPTQTPTNTPTNTPSQTATTITGILCGDWQSNTQPLPNDEFENIILGNVNFDSKLLSGETIDPSGSFVDIVSYSTIGSETTFSVPSGYGTLQFYTSSSIGEFPTIIINQGGINEVVNTFTFSGYVLTDSARLLTLDNITSPYTSFQGIGGSTPQSNAFISGCTLSPVCNATSSIVLRYHPSSASNACSALNATTFFTFDGSNFANTDLLYINNNCTGVAPNGYYSNGTIVRYWNGSNLDTTVGCN